MLILKGQYNLPEDKNIGSYYTLSAGPGGRAVAWLLGSRFRIPLGAWMFVSCVYMLCCPA
jgi:hypothetical protein